MQVYSIYLYTLRGSERLLNNYLGGPGRYYTATWILKGHISLNIVPLHASLNIVKLHGSLSILKLDGSFGSLLLQSLNG